MKKQTKKQVKGAVAMVMAGLFLMSACATTSYVPRKSGMIKIMPKGYQKDDELFKRGIAKGGLMEAVESNEKALRSARQSSRNAKWSFGLLWAGVASLFGGSLAADTKKPDSATRNVVGNSLIGTGLGAMLLSIIPAIKSRAQEADAVNKYNDDVLQRLAPQVFTEPAAETKSEEPKSKEKEGSAVITAPQEETTSE